MSSKQSLQAAQGSTSCSDNSQSRSATQSAGSTKTDLYFQQATQLLKDIEGSWSTHHSKVQHYVGLQQKISSQKSFSLYEWLGDVLLGGSTEKQAHAHAKASSGCSQAAIHDIENQYQLSGIGTSADVQCHTIDFCERSKALEEARSNDDHQSIARLFRAYDVELERAERANRNIDICIAKYKAAEKIE
ncbi:uncharacterized protein I303_108529 [Kwoniella dejecticola CBS 10117]|uniref:Uncharacterized protein n=1 Tax=Kwoniella dejecticola CBS 10117 TaxID=1296121 RepID=A0A1A5ZX51_9TREE|nr:uncharacterized protein I303_07147 [Kwoniella dejecticola CBS 10117]OBR82388.1 hypothetical protein I303_07147 [Kwoniella dejecticola CBS 10117]